ncbi:MAG: PQQ-binding-like beta-propeller repeat protein [Solirubrobacteraceae bacterium]
MSSGRSRRSWRSWLAVGGLLVVVIAAAGVLVVILHKPGNVSNPSVPFTTPRTVTTTTTTHKPVVVDNFTWPIYGFTDNRTRDFTGAGDLRPPLHVGWRFGGNALVEFPPVIFRHTLYFMDDGATAKAISARTGQQFWATHLGTLSAASPALDVRQQLLFVPILSDTGTAPGNGSFDALSMRNGHVVWSRPLPSGSEASPIVSGDSVYFGDQAGTVYSLNTTTGRANWTYQASGPVKGGPALVHGILFFGDYDGRAYAVDAATGHQVWAVDTSGSDFGFGSGNFYASPAVAYGRIYLGNTDGFVYSFAVSNGALGWSVGTGAYVYASASVADLAGVGPTVYVGSYSGEFYAFNARTGAVRWTYDAGGRISGSSTVVNGVVYFADLASRTTIGLDARTGHVVYTFPDGAFTPVIADPHTIFLSGYDTIYELLPGR